MFRSNEDFIFNVWVQGLESALDAFLEKLKEKRSFISTVNPSSVSVVISYLPDRTDSALSRQSLSTLVFAERLSSYLKAIGMRARALPLTLSLEQDLQDTRFTIVLCTPAYADFIKAHPALRAVLNTFGSRNKNALQPLLCEGGFGDTALQIADQHYLVRDFKEYLQGHAYHLKWVTPTQPLESISFRKGEFYVESLPDGLKYSVLDQGLKLKSDLISVTELRSMGVPTHYSNLESFKPYSIEVLKRAFGVGHLGGDLLRPLESFIDLFIAPSGTQGLGLLPDILGLKEKSHVQLAMDYERELGILESTQAALTIDYRLKHALAQSIDHHPLKDSVVQNFPTLLGFEQAGFEPFLAHFLAPSNKAKISLLLCDARTDVALTDIALMCLLQEKGLRVLSVNCQNYAGKASQHMIKSALQALKLKEKSVIQSQPLVLFLKGYQDLGAYDNLYVQNRLSHWKNLKVLVTCESSFFAQRGYLNCFLKSGSERRIEDLSVYEVPAFASVEAKEALLLSQGSGQIHKSAMTMDAEVKAVPLAQDVRFQGYQHETQSLMNKVRALSIEHGLLQGNVAQNAQVFISYAWEPIENQARAYQQFYLKAIANHLRACGLRPWLDLEQMSGDIDAQMAQNIQDSDLVLVVGTPLYVDRAAKDTNVRKEYQEILKQQQERSLAIIGLHYLGNSIGGSFPKGLQAIPSVEARHLQSIDNYLAVMGATPKSLFVEVCNALFQRRDPQLFNAFKHDCIDLESEFQAQLQLLPAKYLISDRNQALLDRLEIESRLEGYIEPYALFDENAALNTRFKLRDYFNQFLQEDHQTFIALAPAGSGKSLFALATFQNQAFEWVAYRANPNKHPRPMYLPIYIALREHSQNPDTVIETALSAHYGLLESEIKALQSGLHCGQRLLFICDGYDELGALIYPNLSEQLRAYPTARLLITSRPEHFDNNHLVSNVLKPIRGFLKSIMVSPFVPSEIERYVRQYEHDTSADPNATYQVLKDLPGMMALLDNPFLLNLVLQSLPVFLANRQQQASQYGQEKVIRGDIYEAFVDTWFRQETQGRERYITPHQCQRFAKQLAFELFKAKVLNPRSEYSSLWALFEDHHHTAAREAMPLRLNNGLYSFIHKSVYEYFVAQFLYQALSAEEMQSAWNSRHVLEEPGALSFMVERYQRERVRHTAPYDALMALIRGSALNAAIAQAASSAITLLNRAGVSFSALDLSGIQIPGADLSGGIFDGTNFEAANLSNVHFVQSWLSRASFRGANLLEVQFGEWPSCSHELSVQAVCYSPLGWDLYFIRKHDLSSTLSSELTPALVLCSNQKFKLIIEDKNANICYIDASKSRFAEAFSQIFKANFLKGKQFFSAKSELMQWIVSKGHSIAPKSLYVAAGNGNLITIYDAKTLQKQWVYEGHTESIIALNYSFDGKYLCSGSEDNTLKVWDASGVSLKALQTYFGHTDSIRALSYSLDGNYICSGSRDETLKVWDASGMNLEALRTYRGHRDAVYALSYSPDGKYICSGSRDKTLKVWDASGMSLEALRTYRGHTDFVTALSYSPDGKYIYSGSYDKTLKVWDASGESLQILKAYEGHTREVYALSCSPDGKYVCSGSRDHTLKIWDASGVSLDALKTYEGHMGEVYALSYSPDGKYICSGSRDHTLKIWDVSGFWLGKIKVHDGHTSSIYTLSYSPDGKHVCSGSWDNTLKLWDASVMGFEILRTYEGHTNTVTSLSYSPDGRYVCSGSYDNTLKVWDVSGVSLEALRTYRGHMRQVHALSYSPDGKHICSSSFDHTLKVWDANGVVLEALKTYEQHGCIISSLSYSLDGKYVCSGSNKMLKVWNATGTEFEALRLYEGHEDIVTSLSYSPDGKYVCSGSFDHTLKVWDASGTSLRALKIYEGHRDTVTSLSYSPDGKYICSGSLDKTLRVWDTGDENLAALNSVDIGVSILSISFSPTIDSQGHRFFVTGHDDGNIMCWDMSPGARAVLVWREKAGPFRAQNLNLESVCHLSNLNLELLKQRGAIGEPISLRTEKTSRLSDLNSTLNLEADTNLGLSMNSEPLLFSGFSKNRSKTKTFTMNQAVQRKKCCFIL